MRFRVKALAAGGGIELLRIDAPGRDAAGAIARSRGLSVLSVQPEFLPWSRATLANAGSQRGRGSFSVPLFAQQLIALLAAGLGTVEALEAIATEAGAAGGPLREVLSRVRAGRSLSDALAAAPNVFPTLFVATVRASERTGDLREALGRYVDYHAQLDRVRSKVVSASVYPLMLALTGAVVTAFLLFYVVPRFGQIYEDIGGELPLLSRLLIEWGRFLSNHFGTVIAAFAAALAGLAVLVSRPWLRRWVWQRLWRIPRVGHMLRIFHLSRFYRTLGMLLRSGMPLLPSLDLSRDLLDPVLRPAVAAVRGAVNEGSALSVAMSAQGLTTPMALGMLRVGERTGEFGTMMDRAAALYDDELGRWVDLTTRLFEPILMAAIGVVIGAIVVLLYLPVFELASQLQ